MIFMRPHCNQSINQQFYANVTTPNCPVMGKFLYSLESFHILWKVSVFSGKFLYSLESFHILWKVSVFSGKFPYTLESFRKLLEESQDRTFLSQKLFAYPVFCYISILAEEQLCQLRPGPGALTDSFNSAIPTLHAS